MHRLAENAPNESKILMVIVSRQRKKNNLGDEARVRPVFYSPIFIALALSVFGFSRPLYAESQGGSPRLALMNALSKTGFSEFKITRCSVQAKIFPGPSSPFTAYEFKINLSGLDFNNTEIIDVTDAGDKSFLIVVRYKTREDTSETNRRFLILSFASKIMEDFGINWPDTSKVVFDERSQEIEKRFISTGLADTDYFRYFLESETVTYPFEVGFQTFAHDYQTSLSIIDSMKEIYFLDNCDDL